ncbi:MAG: RNA polymerase sigma factor [Fimbriimonadaceae bacterium]|nr:MAG: RNA polymerase sigma factor, sigma-70 family [Armatimonadetes bacterium OLB18]WKZ81042.1 MAG: RNA polymerase sigma factor [Fimbriimonadaceae bacterium]
MRMREIGCAARVVRFAREERGSADLVLASIDRWRVWGYRLALKITGCPDAAADAVQEALIRAHRSRGSLRSVEAADGWFKKTLVRAALDQRARESRALPEQPAASDPDLGASLQVRLTLRKLKPEQRALLALALGAGYSYAEIAYLLDVPEGTVASRLHAAKSAFRKKWEEAQ